MACEESELILGRRDMRCIVSTRAKVKRTQYIPNGITGRKMPSIRRAKRAQLLFVIAVFTGTVDVGNGAGFQLLEQNASGLGNAYAGQAAAAENASAIHYNPASMTLLPGTQFSGSALALRLSIKFRDSGASLGPNGAGVPAGGTNGGDAGGDWNYLPSLFLTRQISPKLWLGVGLSAPFGLKTQYEPDFIGRFQSQKTVIKSYDINPSVAYGTIRAVQARPRRP
jgi:long-chain fatty acid transport protein